MSRLSRQNKHIDIEAQSLLVQATVDFYEEKGEMDADLKNMFFKLVRDQASWKEKKQCLQKMPLLAGRKELTAMREAIQEVMAGYGAGAYDNDKFKNDLKLAIKAELEDLDKGIKDPKGNGKKWKLSDEYSFHAGQLKDGIKLLAENRNIKPIQNNEIIPASRVNKKNKPYHNARKLVVQSTLDFYEGDVKLNKQAFFKVIENRASKSEEKDCQINMPILAAKKELTAMRKAIQGIMAELGDGHYYSDEVNQALKALVKKELEAINENIKMSKNKLGFGEYKWRLQPGYTFSERQFKEDICNAINYPAHFLPAPAVPEHAPVNAPAAKGNGHYVNMHEVREAMKKNNPGKEPGL